MKTISIAAALLIMFSATISIANTSKSTLTFKDSFGRILTMPLMVEEAPDALPFLDKDAKRDSGRGVSEKVYDISKMSKPETEEEIPYELKALFAR